MSVDKLVDSTQLNSNLTSIANAIRTKGGTSATLTFPNDFVSAINAISSSGSGYTRTVVVPEQTVTPVYHSNDNTSGYSAQLNNVTEMFEQWSEYIVTFNGTEYYFTTLFLWNTNFLMGEQAYLWSGDSGTNYPYPFCVISASINDSYIYTASADSVTVKIEKLELTGSGGGSVTWETKSDQGITITFDGTYNYAYWTYTEPLQANETYRITWGEGGTQYICETVATSGGPYDGYYLGNASIVNTGENTGEPFILYRNNATTIVVTTTQSTGSWRIKIEKQVSTSVTLISKTISANGTYSASSDEADGYNQVTVNVPTPAAMNVQTAQSTDRRNNTALGSVTSLTCSTAGTYDVYWSCARSSTSQTWGSQLYINGSAYDAENTVWTNNVQNNHLTGVTIPANATVAIYGRSRSGYYIYVPQLTIIQTA